MRHAWIGAIVIGLLPTMSFAGRHDSGGVSFGIGVGYSRGYSYRSYDTCYAPRTVYYQSTWCEPAPVYYRSSYVYERPVVVYQPAPTVVYSPPPTYTTTTVTYGPAPTYYPAPAPYYYTETHYYYGR